MQSINPVVVNSKALKKEAELIFQNNQTCTPNINKITQMLSLGAWQSLYVPASMHGAAICQNI